MNEFKRLREEFKDCFTKPKADDLLNKCESFFIDGVEYELIGIDYAVPGGDTTQIIARRIEIPFAED